jgi:hypothetical protein
VTVNFDEQIRNCLQGQGDAPGLDAAQIQRLRQLLRQLVEDERRACAEIADAMARLKGSQAAEEIAARILARGERQDGGGPSGP